MFAGIGQRRGMQWSIRATSKVLRAFDRLVRLRPAQAWILVLFCADTAAFADLLTGPDLWLGPVYLLVMCLATWSLGWRAGQATGIGCMGLTFALNGWSLYPHGDSTFAWNLGMRFVAMSIVIAIIAGVRHAYVREWWRARTDPLTSALNRQAFFELAPTGIDSQRWRLLVYADLDGLKKVNDVKGHAAGDACLQAFGTAVRKVIRQDDVFARVGGDEFLIFMSMKDEAAARKVALRLHKAMNSVQTKSGILNCSVGALVIPPGEASLDDLVRSADNLMYGAKLRGACLQLGVACDVRRPVTGRDRRTSRISSYCFPGGKQRFTDRRTSTASSFVRERAPH